MSSQLDRVLARGISLGLIFLLWMPLIITQQTIFSFVVGKALYARVVIEIVAVLWLALLLRNPIYRPPRSWVLLAFLGYLIITFSAAVWGINFERSIWSTYERMTGTWALFHWFLFILIAASVLRSSKEWNFLLNLNLAVALVLSLLGLAQMYGIPIFTYVLPKCRVYATLGNPSYLAAILMVSTIVAAGFLARSFVTVEDTGGSLDRQHEDDVPLGSRRALFLRRMFWGAVAALGLLVLFQTGSRGAFIGLVSGAVAMPVALMIWGNRRALRPVALTAAAVILGIAALFAWHQTFGFPVRPSCRGESLSERVTGTRITEGNIATRLFSAKAGIRAFLERPVLGWGPENFTEVFERFVEPSYYSYSTSYTDRAHNKLVGELATKGVLGTLAYLGIWVALVWAVLRRHRPPGEETLAYIVLGALFAYFVQNLFLFDTPPTMLQWALLVAWVAGQEQLPRGSQRQADGNQGFDIPRPALRLISSPWVKVGVVSGVTALLGLSLYFLNYKPYVAAMTLDDAFQGERSVLEGFRQAQAGFDTFPALSNVPKLALFNSLVKQWIALSEVERQEALGLAVREGDRALKSKHGDVRVLTGAAKLMQKAFLHAPSRSEGVEMLVEPLLARLLTIAPNRVQTHQIAAAQEFLKGNYSEAISIAEHYEVRVPGAERFFLDLKRDAQVRLAHGALEAHSEDIRLNPQLAEAYVDRGLDYAELGQFEQAIRDYDEAIRLNPEYPRAYNNRGTAYTRLGYIERGIEDYDEAIRLNPQFAPAYNNLGNAYSLLGQLERAIEDYNEAIRLNPQFGRAYANRAKAYTLLGKDAQAEQDVEGAIERGVDPNLLKLAIEELKQQRSAD